MSTTPLTDAAFITTGIRHASPEPGTECSICYEPLAQNVVRTVACNHSFHLACITQWTCGEGPTNCKCPLCRQTLFRAVENELWRESLVPGVLYPHGVPALSEYGYMGTPTVGGPGSTGPGGYGNGYGYGYMYMYHYPGGYPVGYPPSHGYETSYYRHGPVAWRRSRSPEHRPDRYAGVSEPRGSRAESEAPQHPQGPTSSRNHGIPSAQSLANGMAQLRTEIRPTGTPLSDEELRRIFRRLLDTRPVRPDHPSRDLPRARDQERSPTHVEYAEHTTPIEGGWASSLRSALPPLQNTPDLFFPSRTLVNENRSRTAADPTSHPHPRPRPRGRYEFSPRHDRTVNPSRDVSFERRAAELSGLYAPAGYEWFLARGSSDNRWTPSRGDVPALSPDDIREIRGQPRQARHDYLRSMREAEEEGDEL